MEGETLDHEKHDVYQAARQANAEIHRQINRLPSGNSDLVDQLKRAAASVSLNIAEGSGEFTPKEKSRFYRIARRSGTECAAILDLLVDREVMRESDASPVRDILERVIGMLVRMVRNLERPGTSTGSGTGTGRGASGTEHGHARGG